MYFDEMERTRGTKEYNKALENITCNFKPRCCNVGAVTIEEQADEKYPQYPFISVKFFFAPNEEILDTYLKGQWYGEKSCKKLYDLGCDTSRFEMEINNNYCEFSTGADGYYGWVRKMKEYYGLMGELSFDGSLFTVEEIEESMRYLFGAKQNLNGGEKQ